MAALVYPFDAELPRDRAVELVGGKGAGLNEMTRLGVPVPPGFTITTEVSRRFLAGDGGLDTDGRASATPSLGDDVKAAVKGALAELERATGKRFGSADAPLLVSVRSGAAASMPGMMDTILNLGLGPSTLGGLARASGDQRFALDAYRRLLHMYGDVVMGVASSKFEALLSKLKVGLGRPRMLDAELDAPALERLVGEYERLVAEHTGAPFPDDPEAQLWGAIGAVFRSWNNPRAKRYRAMQGIPEHLGTACTVQAMVFGNLGETSGSGVAFTRNPSTGERVLYGEYLANAQGEDVVAGTRTPSPLTAAAAPPGREHLSLERAMPEAFAAIVEHCARLERHFRDLQDIEFTVQAGETFILQTRAGKRTAQAGVRIAVDMVREGLLERDEALLRLDAGSLDQLLKSRLPRPEELAAKGIEPLAGGLPASPGAATGQIVFDADDAVRAAAEGRDVILVRRETSPEDVHGMKAALGILTAAGGMTSHAAVVARGLGKCCVAGCSQIAVDYAQRRLSVRSLGAGGATSIVLQEGDEITLDGTTGKVYAGVIDLVPAATLPELDLVMAWADEARRLEVRANADTPRAARAALLYGAEGIGLCRTEHTFFEARRLLAARCLALADDAAEAKRHAEELEAAQRPGFRELFEAVAGRPLAVRLFDWPLHTLMPRDAAELAELAAALDEDLASVEGRVRSLSETNPLLGHRGARLALTRPHLHRTQLRAILGGALDAARVGLEVRPELLVPIVASAEELRALARSLRHEAEALFAAEGRSVAYRLGVILELPRACLVAGAIAREADFFTFGTHDLTQTTYGIARQDAAAFLGPYVQPLGIFTADPFARLDRDGVGRLIEMAVADGRRARPGIEAGMCGDHGGEPDSIDFCEGLGMQHVSCAAPRVPTARLAAAQATLRQRAQVRY
jgi:pyruvate,orthophosphate dikinase